jgi:hypothetical protein
MVRKLRKQLVDVRAKIQIVNTRKSLKQLKAGLDEKLAALNKTLIKAKQKFEMAHFTLGLRDKEVKALKADLKKLEKEAKHGISKLKKDNNTEKVDSEGCFEALRNDRKNRQGDAGEFEQGETSLGHQQQASRGVQKNQRVGVYTEIDREESHRGGGKHQVPDGGVEE